MTDDSTDIPAGFQRLPTGLGFTDAIQPLYRRVDEQSVSYGLRVQEHHTNSLGICHGGVLMTFADIAAASGVNHARGTAVASPTINLSVDFITAAKLGEWLQVEIQNVSVKRRFGFCSGIVNGSRGPVIRFNGTFYQPDHDGLVQAGKTRPTALSVKPE